MEMCRLGSSECAVLQIGHFPISVRRFSDRKFTSSIRVFEMTYRQNAFNLSNNLIIFRIRILDKSDSYFPENFELENFTKCWPWGLGCVFKMLQFNAFEL